MKLVFWKKNHFGGQIWYRSLKPSKNGVFSTTVFQFLDFETNLKIIFSTIFHKNHGPISTPLSFRITRIFIPYFVPNYRHLLYLVKTASERELDINFNFEWIQGWHPNFCVKIYFCHTMRQLQLSFWLKNINSKHQSIYSSLRRIRKSSKLENLKKSRKIGQILNKTQTMSWKFQKTFLQKYK